VAANFKIAAAVFRSLPGALKASTEDLVIPLVIPLVIHHQPQPQPQSPSDSATAAVYFGRASVGSSGTTLAIDSPPPSRPAAPRDSTVTSRPLDSRRTSPPPHTVSNGGALHAILLNICWWPVSGCCGRDKLRNSPDVATLSSRPLRRR
jgi:hypothetical protein